jgi:ribosome biogenesis GTPase A
MVSTPPIQWYPGHIAKAERALLDQLNRVDVVFEVRDARIPMASAHPQVPTWIGEKPRVLILNRMDTISPVAQEAWRDWLKRQGETPYFTNAQQGNGIAAVVQAAQRVGDHLNQRRSDRGMLPRPVRGVVIGFPNVGKSALINRLVRKRVVDSARRPGVTRQLRWVRVSKQIEVLDAPGVLPSKLTDQQAAYRLAMCDDIGHGGYDHQRVAAALVDQIQRVEAVNDQLPDYVPLATLTQRYGIPPTEQTGEQYLVTLAETNYQGDRERVAQQLLNDFRKGLLGTIALETPL